MKKLSEMLCGFVMKHVHMDGTCQKIKKIYICSEAAARDRCFRMYTDTFRKMLIAGGIATVFAVAMAVSEAAEPDGVVLERQGYGGETTAKTVETVIDGETADFSVEVLPLEYGDDELDAVFDKAFERIDNEYLGANESADEVSENLNLMDYIDGLGVSVDWLSEDYEIVGADGVVASAKEDMNVVVKLIAIVSYGDESAERDYNVRVVGKKESDMEKAVDVISENIHRLQLENPGKAVIEVPGEIEGYSVSNGDKGSGCLLAVFLGIVAMSALWTSGRTKVSKLEKQRNSELMAEYPGLVDKITMYLGAGLTVRGAFGRVEEASQSGSALEREIRYTLNEIKSGVPESEAYYNMGHRINMPVYVKLMSLLSQNIKKGTKDILVMMANEEQAAVQARKELAKKKGEEAGTKLLFPMIVLLGIVMVIVILPAVLGF